MYPRCRRAGERLSRHVAGTAGPAFRKSLCFEATGVATPREAQAARSVPRITSLKDEADRFQIGDRRDAMEPGQPPPEGDKRLNARHEPPVRQPRVEACERLFVRDAVIGKVADPVADIVPVDRAGVIEPLVEGNFPRAHRAAAIEIDCRALV